MSNDAAPGWSERASATDYPEGPACPRCTKSTELHGEKRTPYCRTCHQFVVDGRLGDCRSREANE